MREGSNAEAGEERLDRLLQRTGWDLPVAEQRLIAAEVLARSTAWVFAHGDHTPNAEQALRLEHLLQRRIEGEPLAYLLGRREFYGRDFRVTPDVLIPRPETELLVETVFDRGPSGPARIIDVGTGSGCIALTLALERPDWEVLATDLSASALAVAQGNGQQLGGTVEWIETDLLAGVPGPFHVIVSNPPYVAAGDPHLTRGDLRFEPLTALTDEGDGLVLIRRLIQQASQCLHPGGELWLEHGYDQAERVRELLIEAGFEDVESRKDLAGIERVSGGRWPH
jgi:release factor glutamine methyltransferase